MLSKIKVKVNINNQKLFFYSLSHKVMRNIKFPHDSTIIKRLIFYRPVYCCLLYRLISRNPVYLQATVITTIRLITDNVLEHYRNK